MVETAEASATRTVKTLRGQRSWPGWVDVVCALVVCEEETECRRVWEVEDQKQVGKA